MTDPLYIMEALTDAILRVQEHQGAYGTYGDPPLRGKMSEDLDALLCEAVQEFGPLQDSGEIQIIMGYVIFQGVPFRIMPIPGMWFMLDISPIREKS